MKYYPVFLDINGKTVLVVGGGAVGARKAAMLSKCGAHVVAVSLEFCREFTALSQNGVFLQKRPYEETDLDDVSLVFAATNSRQLNAKIKSDAIERNIMCNIADAPDQSSFILPSVLSQGDLMIAVSTSGASPAVAKMIRQELDRQYGPHYADLLKLMRRVREKLLAADDDSNAHRRHFHCLLENGILRAIENGDVEKIDKILSDVLPEGFTYEKLLGPNG